MRNKSKINNSKVIFYNKEWVQQLLLEQSFFKTEDNRGLDVMSRCNVEN